MATRLRLALLAHRADPAPLRDAFVTAAMLVAANSTVLWPAAPGGGAGRSSAGWRSALGVPYTPPPDGVTLVEAAATLRRRRQTVS